MTARRVIGLLFLVALLAAVPVFAAEKSLGTFGSWRAYMQNDGGQQVCYMVTTKLMKSTSAKRGTPYMMITHRPIEASRDVVSYGAGAALEERRGVKLRIGVKNFDLFAVRDIAWARDPQTDHKIAAAMQGSPMAQFSSYVQVKKKKQSLTDRFDLSGATGAYHAISKACGYIRDAPKIAKIRKKKTARTSY